MNRAPLTSESARELLIAASPEVTEETLVEMALQGWDLGRLLSEVPTIGEGRLREILARHPVS